MSEANVEDVFVEVPGGQVFVRRWGREHASSLPVVLLHDSLGSVEQWRDFPAVLAHRLDRPVIAYDRLGFGRSSARGERPSIHFIAEEADVHFPALCHALGLEAYGLFGHSVGGAMALAIAAAQGDRCRFVVTESAQAFVEQRTLDGIVAAQAQFERDEQFARLARWHGDKAAWVLDAWTQVWLDPAFAAWSLDHCLPQVRCPVLAIHGDGDEFGSVAFPERIARGVQGPAQRVVLEACGHVPHREQPEQVLQLVSHFIELMGE